LDRRLWPTRLNQISEETETNEMSETDTVKNQHEIFRLLLAGGDSGKLRASELIRKLSPEARRDLRAALQVTDELVDDVWLQELRERHRK
jgi:hypothetical protein